MRGEGKSQLFSLCISVVGLCGYLLSHTLIPVAAGLMLVCYQFHVVHCLVSGEHGAC